MQRENKWQDRFDEMFDHLIPKILCGDISKIDIRHFIQSEIDLAVKEERERLTAIMEAQFKQHTEFLKGLKQLTDK